MIRLDKNAENRKAASLLSAPDVLAEVHRIVTKVLGRHVAVYLFGSWARGQATRASDIDIAIQPSRPLPPGALAELREQLEESRIPYRVEVVDLTQVAPSFRNRVLQEGIPWNV